MKKVETSVVDNGLFALGDNVYEAGLLKNVAAGTTVKAGTFLKRDGNDFAVLTNTGTEKIAGLVPVDLTNESGSASNVAFRALISGKVRADKCLVNGTPAMVEQLDALRVCSIIPVEVTDLSRTE
ncbi:hypothetical protein E4N90_03875 [Treponema denticola]|uniref:hypothetical protein n=1 Tax=Treponema denticola TaxID=158 RepID=UPI0020A5DE8F|nr:hypothetical protein [Treponema denticola]UTD07131.1 hypothetical protein E4N90_03875 [Treponema denticola]